MKVLLVKSSSLRDLIHTLPALSDAQRHHPELCVDWVTDEVFAEIPRWHGAVNRVLPAALKRWRRDPKALRTELWPFVRTLRQHAYARVIDADGVRRSALLTVLARGASAGYDKDSAPKAVAAKFYRHRYPVAHPHHAIERTRHLFAAALGYPKPQQPPDFGIQLPPEDEHNTPYQERLPSEPYLVFLHGTVWATKHWPPSHWNALAAQAGEAGYRVLLPWGSSEERQRVELIVTAHSHAEALPPLPLTALAHILGGAHGVVTLDTDLGHLAAALGAPCVGIYGATDAALAGLTGRRALSVTADLPCAPCLQPVCTLPRRDPGMDEPPCMYDLTADRVWERLQNLLA